MNKRRNWYEQKVDDTYRVLHDVMLSSWVQKYWGHWEELTCASRWKSREIMQMFVKYKRVWNTALQSQSGLLQKPKLQKPKNVLEGCEILETIQEFTLSHGDTSYCLMWSWQSRIFLCYLLQLSEHDHACLGNILCKEERVLAFCLH